MAAKDFDSRYHRTPDAEIGSVLSALLSFGPVAGNHKDTVPRLGLGCFGELPAGFKDVHRLIARNVRYPARSLRRQAATSRSRRPLACSARAKCH